MRLSKKIFFLSTYLIGSFLTCSTEARLIQRQAYMICKTDEVAFWNGSSGQCCRGDIFKALETNNYQCCETPNVISTVLGNPYLKACCPPGQTPYTTSTPSNPETSTLSWCCDGDASEHDDEGPNPDDNSGEGAGDDGDAGESDSGEDENENEDEHSPSGDDSASDDNGNNGGDNGSSISAGNGGTGDNGNNANQQSGISEKSI